MADYSVTEAKKKLTRVLQQAQAGRPVRITRHGAVIFDSSETIHAPQAGEPLDPKLVEALRTRFKRNVRADAGDYIRRARDAARR